VTVMGPTWALLPEAVSECKAEGSGNLAFMPAPLTLPRMHVVRCRLACRQALAVLPGVELNQHDDLPGMRHNMNCLLEVVGFLPGQGQGQAAGDGMDVDGYAADVASADSWQVQAAGRPPQPEASAREPLAGVRVTVFAGGKRGSGKHAGACLPAFLLCSACPVFPQPHLHSGSEGRTSAAAAPNAVLPCPPSLACSWSGGLLARRASHPVTAPMPGPRVTHGILELQKVGSYCTLIPGTLAWVGAGAQASPQSVGTNCPSQGQPRGIGWAPAALSIQHE